MFHGLVTLISIVSLSIHRIEYLERVVKEFNSTFQELQERIQGFELKIAELNSRLTVPEAATTESTIAKLVTVDRGTPEMTTTVTGQCEFNVSGICYWSYVNYDNTNFINFTDAQQICADKGFVPAYFPTELAYNKTVESLRAKIMADGKMGADVYTGVMVDGQTFKVTYPYTEVYMEWYPGFPPSQYDATSVFLAILSNYDDINQGMFNYPPSWRGYGVVCQGNLN